MAAHVASQPEQVGESPLDEPSGSKITAGMTGPFDSGMVQAIAKEMLKLMKGKGTTEVSAEQLNSFAHFAGMVGNSSHSNICCTVNNSPCGSWIVDTGASDHMSYNPQLFTHLHTLNTPIHITLPDGSHKTVTHAGSVTLCPQINLHNILYVPEFKFNLISVSKLLTDLHLTALFTPHQCTFQDLSTRKPVAIAPVDSGL